MGIMRKHKAILFDFDGVLGMTMEDNAHAWEYALSRHNIRFDKNEYLLFEGLNTKKVVEHFAGCIEKIRINVEDIVKLKEEYYIENNSFSLYEGGEALISRLKKEGYLLGLVTAANYIRLSNTVDSEVISSFNVIITGDKVNNCKPHPESYLNAANALSVKPSDCVVVENAPLGIESAKAAGMYCIAVASTLEKKYLFKANRIINKLSELEGIL
jgi:beta-phosphoglucomutase